MSTADRSRYAALFGPTAGDQIRLADTDLWIEIEHDYTATGDEMVFGGGKSIRESMGQGVTTREQGALDVVITNVVILDHWESSAQTSEFATDASSRSASPVTPTS